MALRSVQGDCDAEIFVPTGSQNVEVGGKAAGTWVVSPRHV